MCPYLRLLMCLYAAGAGTGRRDDGPEGNGHSDGCKDLSFGSPSEDPSQRGGGIWHAYHHKDKAPSPIQQLGDAPEVMLPKYIDYFNLY